MNLQRKVSLMVLTGAVALGAGHFVQNKAANRFAGDMPAVAVSSVTPVAAGPQDNASAALPVVNPAEPVAAAKPLAVSEETADALSAKMALTPAVSDNCAMQLDLIAQPDAMIGLSLLAPCHTEQRVVLRHAGLAVTGRTSASGSLFATLPALTALAEVEVGFASGEQVAASVGMPDFEGVQRFAVQWQDADAFQLHAFEKGADYDKPGHISAAFTGVPGESGFLTVLGDASTSLPLLAEVYTFGPDRDAEIVVEAAVTEETCGRETLGETLYAAVGTVEITDLTLAMPGCDAVGDILVLKNLLQDMTLAAAN